MEPTDPEVADVLRRAMVARIGTVSRNGRPHVNPLYFVVDDGRIHLGTSTQTLAARNVRANPHVQVLFEVESDPTTRRLLRLDGTATLRTDEEVARAYRWADARKYVVTPRGLWNMLSHPRQWRPMRRHLTGGDACVIEMTPTVAEWVARP